jgi:hypothetical protein
LFPDEFTAKDWIDYYLWILPCLAFGYEPAEPPMLMHQQDEANITRLAWFTRQIIDPEGTAVVKKTSKESTTKTSQDLEKSNANGEQSNNHKPDGLQSASSPDTVESLSQRLAGVEGQLEQVLAGQTELRQLLMKLQKIEKFDI